MSPLPLVQCRVGLWEITMRQQWGIGTIASHFRKSPHEKHWKYTHRGQGHLVESCPSSLLRKRRRTSIYTKPRQHVYYWSNHSSCMHLSLAVVWCSPHGCHSLGYSAHWWCPSWDSPWNLSFSNRLSQEVGAVLCGPRPAAAPGRHPALPGRSVCCWMQKCLHICHYRNTFNVDCLFTGSPIAWEKKDSHLHVPNALTHPYWWAPASLCPVRLWGSLPPLDCCPIPQQVCSVQTQLSPLREHGQTDCGPPAS